jgi:hypothetical protein
MRDEGGDAVRAGATGRFVGIMCGMPSRGAAAGRHGTRHRGFRLEPVAAAACLFAVAACLLAAARGAEQPKAERAAAFSTAEYNRHIADLKKKLPGPGFTIVVERPFVVIGDEPADDVRRHCKDTIRWAVDRLKAEYFAQDPLEILDIWLFQDAASYERNCRTIFKQAPGTPYGFFSHDERALVMNIATGGGTLVHEIVHPLMAANFPDCPAWFNEGLGSLYEQSSERGGRIVGLTNWRLAGLQAAIRKHPVRPIKALCGTTDREFYRDDRGTNYAQARYLCYYLQEEGLLRDFYRRFAANHARDPSGYRTLCEVLGREDMEAFQKEWEATVLKLTFP